MKWFKRMAGRHRYDLDGLYLLEYGRSMLLEYGFTLKHLRRYFGLTSWRLSIQNVHNSKELSRMNSYLKRQIRGLIHLALYKDSLKFFRRAKYIIRNSRSFRILCFINVFPRWYREMDWTVVNNILYEASLLFRNLESEYVSRLNYIPKPNGGRRPINVPPKSWRVYLFGVNLMNAIWFNNMINKECQYGHRPGGGVAAFWTQVLNKVVKAPYIFEFDYKKFHDLISHSAISEALSYYRVPNSWKRLILSLNSPVMDCPLDLEPIDSQTLEPLSYFECISHKFNYIARKDRQWMRRKSGVSQGVALAGVLGMVVLERLGVYTMPHVAYLGYADDGLIYGESSDSLELLNSKIRSEESGIYLKESSLSCIKSEGIQMKDLCILGLRLTPEGHIFANSHSGQTQLISPSITSRNWNVAEMGELLGNKLNPNRDSTYDILENHKDSYAEMLDLDTDLTTSSDCAEGMIFWNVDSI